MSEAQAPVQPEQPARGLGPPAGLLLLGLALLTIWLMLLRAPLPPDDLWWRLEVGRTIAGAGGIPAGDSYAYTDQPGATFVNQGWLSDLLLYQAYQLGGLAGLAILRSLLLLLAYALLAVVAWRRSGGSGLASGAALLVAALFGAGDWGLGARTLTQPLLAAFLLALDGYAGGYAGRRALWSLPPLMALWANLDRGFIAGLALLAVYVIGAALASLRRRPGALSRAQLRPLLLAGLATLLATLASPLGAGILSYARQALADPQFGLPTAWQPPTIAVDLKGSLFFMSLLAQPLLWRLRGRPPASLHLLALLLFAWIALDDWRALTWYGMVLVAPLADFLRLDGAGAPRRLAPALLIPLAATGLCLGLAGWLSAPAAQGVRAPSAAVAQLRQLGGRAAQGRLFHHFDYGSYLIWAAPGEQTFIDSRLSLFSQQVWDDYVRINAVCDDLDAVLARYDIRRMLLDTREQSALIEALRQHPGWRLVHEDQQAALFAQEE